MAIAPGWEGCEHGVSFGAFARKTQDLILIFMFRNDTDTDNAWRQAFAADDRVRLTWSRGTLRVKPKVPHANGVRDTLLVQRERRIAAYVG